MLVPKDEGSEFHDANESRQEVDFGIGVPTVDDSRQGKQFGTLIDFRPESMLETLFGIF